MRYTNGDPSRDAVFLDESVEGVDWHREGADVNPYLLVLLLALLAVPVALTAFLVMWIL